MMRGHLTTLLLLGTTLSAHASDYDIDLSSISKAQVRYRPTSTLSEFPVPVLAVRRPGLSSGAPELAEIKKKVIYPVILRSPKPISAIILEWFPSRPEQLGVSIVWSTGEDRQVMLPRAAGGHYDERAHQVFFAQPTP